MFNIRLRDNWNSISDLLLILDIKERCILDRKD